MWAHTKVEHADTLRVIAHDPYPGGPLPADFVMGMGGATETLLTLTPRRHVQRALDLGCGSGVQAVFCNASRVIATDIDARALAAAAATCHLSGFRRLDEGVWREGERLLEFRLGSLFEPVAGQRFDRIVSNPPFIIEGVGHVHRDSPFAGDDLTRVLLQELPAHLNPGGLAIVLATWVHPVAGDWQERLDAWLPADHGVWVAQRDVLDVEAYVDFWGDDAGVPAAEREAWTRRLRDRGIAAVGFGWIVVSADPAHTFRVIEDVADATRIPTGEDVERQLGAFAHAPTAVDMLLGEWRFVSDHWRGDITLDPFAAALLADIRAGHRLIEAVDTVAAAMPVDPDDLRIHGLALMARLADLGFLVHVGSDTGI